MTPLDTKTSGQHEIIGSCGFNAVMDDYTYEFSDNNFFLGLGGVPEGRWSAISPFTVPLKVYDEVRSFEPEFTIPPLTEYHISPPAIRGVHSAYIAFPKYIQTPMCTRGQRYKIEIDTEMWDGGSV